MYANIIVNISSSNVDQMFEYIVPQEFNDYILVGSRVIVPFGLSNRTVMGYVLELYEDKRYDKESKEILELLDLKTVITEKQINLAYYLKEDTLSPLCRILNMMIPSSLQTKTFKYLKIVNFEALDASVMALFNGSTTLVLNKNLVLPMNKINKEIKNGNLKICYEAKQVTNYKYLHKYYLNPSMINNYQMIRSENVRLFLKNFEESHPLTKNDIIDNYDITLAQINNLIKKGYLKEKNERTLRIKEKDIPLSDIIINHQYSELIDRINDVSKPYLLVSHDDNEELNILLELIYRTFEEKKNVVVFTPNILSSIKYASILRKVFKTSVACINSNISKAEYLDYYTNILDDEYRIIVTTPVAAFLPYQNIGLYLMLSEESDNYFNDQSPRFDLHRALHYMSYNYKTLFVISSISPSVTSYAYGLKGVYNLIDRSNDDNIDNITTIDLKNELRSGNNSYLSHYLIKTLDDVINNNKQALLIVNNKDSSGYVQCRACGEVLKCPKCNLSYHYSEKKDELICPSCGKREVFNHICPSCGQDEFVYGGIGQEEIYKRLIERYDNNKVLLLSDGSNFDQYLEELNIIENDEVNIIITSETIAKGAINKKMDKVVIINFDSILKKPSYDANSHAYNLLVYAKSYLKEGEELIVQTTYLNSSPLKHFIASSFHDFIREEINERKLLKLEPFYHINQIIVKAKYEDLFRIASSIKMRIKEIGGNNVFVLGPVYSKIAGGAIITIKHRYSHINKLYQAIYEQYQNSNAVIIFNKYVKNI